MNIALVYVYPRVADGIYEPLARRFVRTYQQFPPTQPVKNYIIGNGAECGPRQRAFMDALAPTYALHNNSGRDIGAFQAIAPTIKEDLMICCGAHVQFIYPGWLDRIVDTYIENGPGLYGAFAFKAPRPHIRTTFFWLPPMLMHGYPEWICDMRRYAFEHGPDSITLWSARLGFPTLMVTKTGVFDQPNWEPVGPDDCLVHDQHTDRQGWT